MDGEVSLWTPLLRLASPVKKVFRLTSRSSKILFERKTPLFRADPLPGKFQGTRKYNPLSILLPMLTSIARFLGYPGPWDWVDPRGDWRHFVLCFIADMSYIGNGEHQCPECGKCYKNQSSLSRHTRYACGPTKLKCVCPHCGRLYSRPDTLTDHMIRVHMLYPSRWSFPISFMISNCWLLSRKAKFTSCFYFIGKIFIS